MKAIFLRSLSCALMFLLVGGMVQAQGKAHLQAQVDSVMAPYGAMRMEWRLVNCDSVEVQGRRGVEPGRQWRVGSIGKVVVALGVLKLAQAGKLNLEDPVTYRWPDLHIEETSPGMLRLQHLLDHSSGLDDMHFREYFAPDEGETVLSRALEMENRTFPIRWEPGSRNAYSNLGYALAALVIEQVTGESAGKWLEHEILAPLGMKDSYFERGQVRADAGKMVPPAVDGNEIAFHRYRYYPALGFVSTADDLTRLVQFFLDGGAVNGLQIIDSELLSRMYKVTSTPAAASEWQAGARGLAFSVWGLSYDPAVRATGHVDGYLAQISILPQHCAAWLMVSNATSQDGAFIAATTQVLDAALPNVRNLPDDHAITPLVRDPRLAGHYRFTSPRNSLFAFHDDLYAGFELLPDAAGTGFLCKPAEGEPFQLQVLDGDAGHWMAATGQVAYAPPIAGTPVIFVNDKRYERLDYDWLGWLRLAATVVRALAWVMVLLLAWAFFARMRGRALGRGAIGAMFFANLPFWSAWLGFLMLGPGNVAGLGVLGLWSVTLWCLSLLVPIATFIGIVNWWRWRAEGAGKWLKWSSLLLHVSNVGLIAYLLWYDLLPMASWMY